MQSQILAVFVVVNRYASVEAPEYCHDAIVVAELAVVLLIKNSSSGSRPV